MQSSEGHVYANSYAISLNSLDKDYDKETSFEQTILAVNETSVVFQLTLPFRQLWNYTVLALGCKQHPVTEMTLLSKAVKGIVS